MWLLIIIAVIGCIVILVSGCNTEADIKRITEFVFGPCDIKPYKKYSKEELKNMLGLVDKNIYLKDFSKGVMHRGEIYFYENKIENYEYKAKIHTCKITGTQDYNISLELDENGKIVNQSCTCKGFDNGYNCKHIFALLYKLKCAENKQKIIRNIENQIVPTSTLMVKYFEEYCKKSNLLFNAMLKNAVDSFDNAINEINNAVEELKLKYTEDTALNILKSIYDAVYDIRESIISVLKQQKEMIRQTSMQRDSDSRDYSSLVTSMLIMDSLKKDNEKIVNKSPYSEKEMDYYGLDDFEKDLVRKGQYAPWDFEHEDTVEGDYYHYD